MTKIKSWKIEWKKGNTTRYYGLGGRTLQVGKYRGGDSFDKTMNQKLNWHGKWYVDLFNHWTKLFNTEKQAKDFATKYMKTNPGGRL